MAITFKRLIKAKYAENTQTAQYTVINVKAAQIGNFTATNIGASNETLSINIVASAGSAGNNNLIVKTVSVAAGQTLFVTELTGKLLETGDFISTIASASNAIVIDCAGFEIT